MSRKAIIFHGAGLTLLLLFSCGLYVLNARGLELRLWLLTARGRSLHHAIRELPPGQRDSLMDSCVRTLQSSRSSAGQRRRAMAVLGHLGDYSMEARLAAAQALPDPDAHANKLGLMALVLDRSPDAVCHLTPEAASGFLALFRQQFSASIPTTAMVALEGFSIGVGPDIELLRREVLPVASQASEPSVRMAALIQLQRFTGIDAWRDELCRLRANESDTEVLELLDRMLSMDAGERLRDPGWHYPPATHRGLRNR